jgi:5-(carboxyamino)imidazole ribonucleotide synthase
MKVGILGGGQLGHMLADAAHAISLETLVLDPKPDAVAGQVTSNATSSPTNSRTCQRRRSNAFSMTQRFIHLPTR